MSVDAVKDYLSLKNIDENFSSIYFDAGKKNILCISPGGGERVHIATFLDKQVVYVCQDSFSAQEVYRKIKAILNDKVDLYQPNDDVLLYRKSFQRSLVGDRVKALYRFVNKECQILVTTSVALTQYMPLKDRLISSIKKIKVDEEIDLYDFIETLVKLGYQREEVCEEKNTFSVHGDIIDIFISNMEIPVRISFFGDIIESIKTYDIDSLLSISSLNELTIYPNNDLLYTAKELSEGISEANECIKKMNIDAATRASQIVSEISANNICTQQAQWLTPFLNKYNSTILDYIEDDGVLIIDEPSQTNSTLQKYYAENEARVKDMSKSGEVTIHHKNAIISLDKIKKICAEKKGILFSRIMNSTYFFEPEEIIRLSTRKVNSYFSRVEVLEEDLKRYINASQMVLICQPTVEKAKKLERSLLDGDIPCKYLDKVEAHKVGIYIISADILEGCIYPSINTVIIGCEDISKKNSGSETKFKNKGFSIAPQVGDYVVHDNFGIGRCLGLKRMKVGGVEQDYIAIEYANGAMLYLPSSLIDKISKYTGSEIAPKLSSLHSNEFSKQKEKVKKSIKKIAFDLVSLYAQRQNLHGYTYPKDDYMQTSFESAFEYELTQDQANAVEEIKEDMEKGRVMDRLICGDVGYGKTEVALRCIFKTILGGKQAAILAPTTILAQQHYRTVKERMQPFGIEVELISRLKNEKEIDTSLKNIKEGKAQVVVGTHRLLSKDVQFNDLGLLVLDEEQRFGVEHKEKLKQLKKNLNVLTLSATPIPRTLNMSLIGVRDISVLETPPKNRLPIQTYVTELTDVLLQDAIKRELARGGQTFVLYNEIETIEKFANKIKQLVPEAKVTFAHGKMEKKKLEEKMEAFYLKQSDVLVATTIIENGIDIPDANTLIVCDADKLGLSQLYQLRGRVGRSNRLAYSFFTIPVGKVLTADGTKRLNAIMDYTELGSGFRIAMRDLEIRGAGNIFGADQHGHIAKVGYDMYCKLINEAVNELNGISKNNVTCLMEVEIPAYLDDKHIKDDNSRIKILKDILQVYTLSERDDLVEKINDSFGEVSQELINLINIGFARNLAEGLMIEKVTINRKGMGVTFNNLEFLKNEKLMDVISERSKDIVLTNEEKPKLVFNCAKKNNVEKLNYLIDFLIKSTF